MYTFKPKISVFSGLYFMTYIVKSESQKSLPSTVVYYCAWYWFSTTHTLIALLGKFWVLKINQEIILTTCHEKARRGLSQEAQKLALVMSTETTCSPE